MAGIFGDNNQVIGGAFTAENCGMTGDGLGDGAVVQRVQFNIERPINFIYEIGSGNKKNFVYYIGGRRRGQAQFERVVGGSKDFMAFITGYGDLCKDSSPIELKAKGGCQIAGTGGGGGGAGVTYKLITPKITGMGVSVQAEQIVITENVQMSFIDLEYQPGGAGAGTGGWTPPTGTPANR